MSEGLRSPATALLLLCGASEESFATKAELRRLAGDVQDWPSLFELASRHAIVPLVEQALSQSAIDLVPAETMHQIRSASRLGALNSLRLSGELVEAMRVLEQTGIDAMPFKGPTLATLVYRNLSLRQYHDLDVLVHRADVERARTALIAEGYSPAIPYSDDQRASLMLTGHHEQLVRGSTTLELHWSLNDHTLTHDSFEQKWWNDRLTIEIGGVAMKTLGPERLLLYLCMHGGKHSWARAGWLFDLLFALRAYPDADWNTIWQLARENGAERMVGIGLTLVGSLLNGGALVARALQSRSVDATAREVSALLAVRLTNERAYDPYLDFRVQVQSRERLRDRLRYTWHMLAAPHDSDVALLGLPRSLHPVYYIVRPIRLVWKNVVRRARPARAT